MTDLHTVRNWMSQKLRISIFLYSIQRTLLALYWPIENKDENRRDFTNPKTHHTLYYCGINGFLKLFYDVLLDR